MVSNAEKSRNVYELPWNFARDFLLRSAGCGVTGSSSTQPSVEHDEEKSLETGLRLSLVIGRRPRLRIAVLRSVCDALIVLKKHVDRDWPKARYDDGSSLTTLCFAGLCFLVFFGVEGTVKYVSF